MTKYLYGANVKAVQSFIFQTGKLKEIIGASELVEQICTSLFRNKVESIGTYNASNCIIAAAGIIKYVFDEEKTCRELVRIFPKVVMNTAPGVIFNQAVVKMTGDSPTPEELKELERRLKTQRNKATPFPETGLRITERSRRTGLPGIKYIDNEVLDKSTKLKKEAKHDGVGSLSYKLLGQTEYSFPEDIKEIADKGNNIAIIHADGNNMGKMIQQLNEDQEESSTGNMDSTTRNRSFSEAIEEVTLAAARTAVTETFGDIISSGEKKLPMRPVILGGDDFTVICRAEYALKLTSVFLAKFEEESSKAFERKELNLPPFTACAGIAYIKVNYPFHYGAGLAEELCAFSKKEAKKKAKENNSEKVPACLTFHRVQSSFVGKYTEIQQQELLAPPTHISWSGRPYYISSENNNINGLMKQVICLGDKNTPTSKLRDWISTCYLDRVLAQNDLERIIKVLQARKGEEIIKLLSLDNLLKKIKKSDGEIIHTTLYDAITLNSLNTKN